jgi:ferredoxin
VLRVALRQRKGSMMKVAADTQKCCSSGMCVVRAPDIFSQRESDGLVIVLQQNPHADLYEAARDAAAACPVQAITLES